LCNGKEVKLLHIGKALGIWLVFAFVAACRQQTPDATSVANLGITFDGAEAKAEASQMAHGRRLSMVLGCSGCHNSQFTGGAFNQGWIAPNLTLLMADYDPASLERAVRQGIALDGRKIRLMPSEMYRSLSDADMRALSTYLLTLAPIGEAQKPFEPFPADLADWQATGYSDGNALGLQWAASSGPLDLGERHARGRYLAMNLCTECHNNQLQGYPNWTPDLIIVASYSDADLERLLKEGKGNAREELGLMSLVSPSRIPYLTEDEYSDLTDYLKARAERLLRE
jgi:cytochrome c553